MFQNEVETTKWSDEGTGDGEHDHHGEDEQHPGIMLSKAELEFDRSSDGWSVSFALRKANLKPVPKNFRKPSKY